jgi:hypothetical protein
VDLTVNNTIELSKAISKNIKEEEYNKALDILRPVLDEKIKFYKLDRLGLELGKINLEDKEKFIHFTDKVIEYDAMGGYVIVSKSLIPLLEEDLNKVMKKSMEYILRGDIWHACDNVSERSIGQGLVDHFEETLPWLNKFLASGEPWLQRSAGVAVHFYTKRVRDDPEGIKRLLEILDPYTEVKDTNAAKGIGWGIKTMGRYYPDITIEFLKAVKKSDKKISNIIWRKAITYLGEKEISEVL